MFKQGILMCLWILVLMEIPLSWKKCRGGRVYVYIGYERNLEDFTVGLSARRATWLMKWAADAEQAGRVGFQELREVMGRWSVAAGVLEYDRPLISPLYSLLAVASGQLVVLLPLFVRVVLAWPSASKRWLWAVNVFETDRVTIMTRT